MADRVDAHHHLWQYRLRRYAWSDQRLSIARRDYLPEESEQKTRFRSSFRIDRGTARQSLDETEWLLSLASASRYLGRWSIIGGAVLSPVMGWISEALWNVAFAYALHLISYIYIGLYASSERRRQQGRSFPRWSRLDSTAGYLSGLPLFCWSKARQLHHCSVPD